MQKETAFCSKGSRDNGLRTPRDILGMFASQSHSLRITRYIHSTVKLLANQIIPKTVSITKKPPLINPEITSTHLRMISLPMSLEIQEQIQPRRRRSNGEASPQSPKNNPKRSKYERESRPIQEKNERFDGRTCIKPEPQGDRPKRTRSISIELRLRAVVVEQADIRQRSQEP